MNINNKRLVEFLLWSGMDPNSLVDLLWILSVLIKRHWKMVYTKKYINEISKVDHNLWSIISVLYKVDKVTQKRHQRYNNVCKKEYRFLSQGIYNKYKLKRQIFGKIYKW